MDSVGIASGGGDKCPVNKKTRDWHKRLHLRKTADQPPAMQSEDKHGPKKIADEWEQSTLWPSSQRPPQTEQQCQQRTNDNGNTLRFKCCQCRDTLEYIPKDLVRHFEEAHRGSAPVFPCHMCSFTTHEFSYLQVHLLSHQDTFSSCSICNDSVQRTWPEFSAHLTMHHCQDGKYLCEKCPNFSTGDVGVYLEHTCAHSLSLDVVYNDLFTRDKSKPGSRNTTQTLHCKNCGNDTSRNMLHSKDVKDCRLRLSCNHKKMVKKKGVQPREMKPKDPVPKMKPRLTRSAVKEMCWLAQDCLSLPGKEFLDKYCHLSDPQKTLEETQQFLMKSVAGENGDQKWTKALKSVLSNVPQDLNLNPIPENGLISNSSDLTVLTVKNKITVAQNGTLYAKTLKVSEDVCGGLDQNGCQSNSSDHASGPQTKFKVNSDTLLPGQSVPSECTQTEENRENQDVTTVQEANEHEGLVLEDGIKTPSQLTLANDCKEEITPRKVASRKRRACQKRNRRNRSKTAEKSLTLPLKIVLKKNPVKERQWVSQSSLSKSGNSSINYYGALTGLHQEVIHNLPDAANVGRKQTEWTKACRIDQDQPSEAIPLLSQTQPGDGTASCSSTRARFKNVDTHGAKEAEKLLEAEANNMESTGWTRQSNSVAEICPEDEGFQTLGSHMRCCLSDNDLTLAADGVTPCSSYTKSSSDSQPVIMPLGLRNAEDLNLVVSSQHSIERTTEDEDARPSVLSNDNSSAKGAIQRGPSPVSRHKWQLAPKNLERILNLVAINPYQLVKHPTGDQPVVVLNHPDADIPEVARIMEVVHRYKGEVQKVMLSRRTKMALSAMRGEVPAAGDLAEGQPCFDACGRNCVQERFILKLKLRRLSRKKYQVVDEVSPSGDDCTRFRCWYCGRVFANQERCEVHRQRHLMKWN